MSQTVIDLIFLSDSSSPSWLPSMNKEMRNGDTITLPLQRALSIAKSSFNFSLDLDSLREGRD